MDDALAPVDEVVSLLNEHSRTTLEQLRQKYPAYLESLEPGQVCGTQEVGPNRTRFKIEVCAEGLRTAIDLLDKLAPALRKRVKRGKNYHFASQAVTTVAGASIFAVLTLTHQDLMKYLVACLALVGTVLSIMASYEEHTVDQSVGSIFDCYKKIIEYQFEAKRISNELALLAKFGFEEPSSSELISQSNEFCDRVNSFAPLLL